jgi:hypothetical protein
LKKSKIDIFAEWPFEDAESDGGGPFSMFGVNSTGVLKLHDLLVDWEHDTASEMGEGVVSSSGASTVWGEIGESDERALVVVESLELAQSANTPSDVTSTQVVSPGAETTDQPPGAPCGITVEADMQGYPEIVLEAAPFDAESSCDTRDRHSAIAGGTVTFQCGHWWRETGLNKHCEEVLTSPVLDTEGHTASVSCPSDDDKFEALEEQVPAVPLLIDGSMQGLQSSTPDVASPWTPAWSCLDTPLTATSDAGPNKFAQWPESRLSDLPDAIPGIKGLSRLSLPMLRVEEHAQEASAGPLALQPASCGSTFSLYCYSDVSEDHGIVEALDTLLESPREAVCEQNSEPSGVCESEILNDLPAVSLSIMECSALGSPLLDSCSPPKSCKYIEHVEVESAKLVPLPPIKISCEARAVMSSTVPGSTLPPPSNYVVAQNSGMPTAKSTGSSAVSASPCDESPLTPPVTCKYGHCAEVRQAAKFDWQTVVNVVDEAESRCFDLCTQQRKHMLASSAFDMSEHGMGPNESEHSDLQQQKFPVGCSSAPPPRRPVKRSSRPK